MTVHLIKLCVGADSLDDLSSWQKDRLRAMRITKSKPELMHVTRHRPKRAEEVLDGGSIYWVINGWILARQKLLELREVEKNGTGSCGLVLDKKLIKVQPRPRKAFQGWRYFEEKDVPPDIDPASGIDALPEKMRQELAELGLL